MSPLGCNSCSCYKVLEDFIFWSGAGLGELCVFKPVVSVRLIWEGGWPVQTLIFEPRAVWDQGFSLWCVPDGGKGH